MKRDPESTVYETVALPLSYVGKSQTPSDQFKNCSDSPHHSHTQDAARSAVSPADGGAPSTLTGGEGKPHKRSACECDDPGDCSCVGLDGRFCSSAAEQEFRFFTDAPIDDAEAVFFAEIWRREARRDCIESGRFVYFIRSDGKLKIGVTGNLKRRLGDLSRGSAADVKLIAAIPGGRTLEAALHRQFSAARLHGEWFALTEDVLGLVRLLSRRASRITRLDLVLAILPDGWWLGGAA